MLCQADDRFKLSSNHCRKATRKHRTKGVVRADSGRPTSRRSIPLTASSDWHLLFQCRRDAALLWLRDPGGTIDGEGRRATLSAELLALGPIDECAKVRVNSSRRRGGGVLYFWMICRPEGRSPSGTTTGAQFRYHIDDASQTTLTSVIMTSRYTLCPSISIEVV